MNIFRFIIVLMVLLPDRLFAVSYSLEGEVSKDFSSIQATVKITGIDNSSLKSSTDNLSNYLRIFAPGISTEQPIRESRGADDVEGRIDDLYWDIQAFTAEKINETTTGFDAVYKLSIYPNLDKENGTSLKDLASDGKVISLVLGWWRWSSSDNKYVKDSVSGTLPVSVVYAAPNEVPSITSVTAGNRSLKIKWSASDTAVYSDAKSRTSPNLNIILVVKDGGQVVDFSNQSYIANLDGSGSGTDVSGGGCTLDPSQTDCLSCAEANAFLDSKALSERAAASSGALYVTSVNASKGAIEIGSLNPDQAYVVLLQYDRGLKRSQCTEGQPILDVTMAEANGENAAGYGSPSCFIASAAFGSRLHPFVGQLRWFRDRYLLSVGWGQRFVAAYYKYGESAAKVVAKSPLLKGVVQVFLIPVISCVMLIKVFTPWGVASIFLAILAIWRVRNSRRRQTGAA